MKQVGGGGGRVGQRGQEEAPQVTFNGGLRHHHWGVAG